MTSWLLPKHRPCRRCVRILPYRPGSVFLHPTPLCPSSTGHPFLLAGTDPVLHLWVTACWRSLSASALRACVCVYTSERSRCVQLCRWKCALVECERVLRFWQGRGMTDDMILAEWGCLILTSTHSLRAPRVQLIRERFLHVVLHTNFRF